MKKIIAFTLVFAILFAFAGCNQSQEKVMKTDIVGEWIAVNGNAAITLYEDGTGQLEYNGMKNVTWSYDPDTDRYTVAGEQSYQVSVSKEYDMPHMNMFDMDFYLFDDYDKAYTLLISRRCEDIVNLTLDMTKIELGMPYNIANAVTFQFTDIEKVELPDGDGLQISYVIINERTDAATDLSVVMNSRCFLANEPKAVEKQTTVALVSELAAADAVAGTIEFSLGTDAKTTVDYYGMVIGALYFELDGAKCYLDLGEWFH